MNELDPSTIDEIAAFLVDRDSPRYLSEPKLREFFARAGIEVRDSGATSRRDLVRQALTGGTSEVTNAELAILRLADPREYAADRSVYEETIRELGEILLPESLKLVHDGRGRPSLVELSVAQEADNRLRGITLKVSLDHVVRDPAIAVVAQERLNEAELCNQAGAYVASIIMLGSLLESILLAAVQERLQRPPPKPLDRLGLLDLIKLAREEGWIQLDAELGSELVRQYRNQVHANRRLAMGHRPDADTMSMCWPVVYAILNDLAATATSA